MMCNIIQQMKLSFIRCNSLVANILQTSVIDIDVDQMNVLCSIRIFISIAVTYNF